jgi:hypothetical protein
MLLFNKRGAGPAVYMLSTHNYGGNVNYRGCVTSIAIGNGFYTIVRSVTITVIVLSNRRITFIINTMVLTTIVKSIIPITILPLLYSLLRSLFFYSSVLLVVISFLLSVIRTSTSSTSVNCFHELKNRPFVFSKHNSSC